MYYNKKYFYEIIIRFISLFSIEAFKNVVVVYHVGSHCSNIGHGVLKKCWPMVTNEF